MSIIIPADASPNVQKAFRDLEDKLDRLTEKVSGIDTGASRSDLDAVHARITQATRKPNSLDPNDVFRGGDAHAVGYVPDPGGGPVNKTLMASGDWDYGVVQEVPWKYDAGNVSYAGTSSAQRVVNLHGSLAVLNALSAETVRCRNLIARVPSVGVYFTADQSINDATETDLLFSAEDHDNFSMHSIASNTDRITIPETGTYCFGVHVIWRANATGVRTLTITLNDPADTATTARMVEDNRIPSVSNLCWENIVATRSLTEGDVLRVNVRHTAGVALTIAGTNTYGPRSNGFWCFKISD